MSTELKSVKSESSNEVTLVAFAGGQERGRCMQLTQRAVDPGRQTDFFQYLQLDEAQVVALAKRCADFLGRNY